MVLQPVRETRKAAGAKRLRLGVRRHPEYDIWWGVLTRCYNPNVALYPLYGGRGITVCNRWLISFENFFEDMGERPSSAHSIGRNDNDGPYDKNNCAWSTAKEQARNRRSSRLITHDETTQSMAAWAEQLGMKYGKLQSRLDSGWTLEQVIKNPHRYARRRGSDATKIPSQGLP